MRTVCMFSMVFAIIGALPSAFGQVAAPTVQLPSFRFFTVNTSVSVPDRGTALLGGVSSSARGRSGFGVPSAPVPGLRNRAFGLTNQTGNVTVSAQIHDLRAMDAEILRIGSQRQGQQNQLAGIPRQLRGHLRPRQQEIARQTTGDQSTADQGAASLETLRRQQATQVNQQQDDAALEFQRALDAEAAGKTGVAKIYYRIAARKAQGDLQKQALAKLRVLENPPQTAQAR